MEAPSTSTIQIFNVYLYKDGSASKAFSDATAVFCGIADTLSNLIRREVVHVSVSMEYSKINIKPARANNNLDDLQLMSLPVSVFL